MKLFNECSIADLPTTLTHARITLYRTGAMLINKVVIDENLIVRAGSVLLRVVLSKWALLGNLLWLLSS